MMAIHVQYCTVAHEKVATMYAGVWRYLARVQQYAVLVNVYTLSMKAMVVNTE